MKKTVGFHTLGCKVNQYETEAMRGMFENAGYIVGSFDEACDVYVINTCTVTGMGDRKSRQIIRRVRAQNENAIVVVAGCYAQVSSEDIEKMSEVNLILGTSNRGEIVRLTEQCMSSGDKINAVGDIMQQHEFEEMHIDSHSEHTRAFVKIQDGCDRYCTYCIIPYARGKVRSRVLSDIVEEVEKLASAGFLEVVLTGIHITSYGKDLGDIALIDVIERINNIDGIQRIRLGSLEPKIIDKDFVSRAKVLKKLCPHFHLPLQSGSDEILKKMGRRYTVAEYMQAVELVRANFDNPAITTDIMVGFPGEAEVDYFLSLELAHHLCFADMHVFSYSPRKGTPAAEFDGQVEPEVKDRRSKGMTTLASQMRSAYLTCFDRTTREVLFESKNDNGVYQGTTDNYITVSFASDVDVAGKIVKSVALTMDNMK